MYRGHYDGKLEQTTDGGLIISDHERGRSAETTHIHERSEEADIARVGQPRGNSVITLSRQNQH